MAKCPRIVITPGEPAGIGPDVVIKLAQQSWSADLIVVADPDLLLSRAELLGLPLSLSASNHSSGSASLTVIPVKMSQPSKPGILAVDNASYVIKTLRIAADLCLENKADAWVTGPVHKSIINDADIPFTGHTEFLATHCKAKQTIMLFVLSSMKVALMTTHIPLSDVSTKITGPALEATLMLLRNQLTKLFNIPNPKIIVCGLNPHAGEGGHLGREEIDVMIPVMQKLKANGLFNDENLLGPLPADTAFIPRSLAKADVVLAMYHDQALPLVKHIGFDSAVNVTLGLPIIRTSVDHGTALDLAGTGLADSDSINAALSLAIKLATQQLSSDTQ